VNGEREGFGQQVAIRFDVVHQFPRSAQSDLQPMGFQLSRALQPPKRVGHFGQHQLWGKHQVGVEQSLVQRGCFVGSFNDPHHR